VFYKVSRAKILFSGDVMCFCQIMGVISVNCALQREPPLSPILLRTYSEF